MVEGTLKPILVNLLLFSLFAFSVVSAGVLIANQNNPSQSIANDPHIGNFTDSINNTLKLNSENSQTSDELLTNSSVTTSTNIVFVDAINGIWKILRGAPTTIWQLTGGLLVNTIGIPLTVIALITSLLVLALVIAVVRFISTGVGD